MRKYAVYEVMSKNSNRLPDGELESNDSEQEYGESGIIHDIVMAADSGSEIDCQFDNDDLSEIEKNLAAYVGPMAKILIKKAC